MSEEKLCNVCHEKPRFRCDLARCRDCFNAQKRARWHERYANDPDFRARHIASNLASRAARIERDPTFHEQKIQYQREYHRRMRETSEQYRRLGNLRWKQWHERKALEQNPPPSFEDLLR